MAVLVAAALFALAFPPIPLVAPAFVCFVPLAVLVARVADAGEPPRRVLRAGFWFGFIGGGLNLYWIAIALSLFTWLASLGYVATIFGLGVISAATLWVLYGARRLTRWPMAVLLPAVWVTQELMLVHFGDLAFPWLPMGLALARVPLLSQFADVSGVHGLSVWVLATNGLLADAWLAHKAGRRSAVIARVAVVLALAIGVATYGAMRLKTVVVQPLAQVGAVQPNIPEDEKMKEALRGRAVGILAQLTRDEVSASDPQLVVWPETALDGWMVDQTDWQDTLQVLAATHHTPLVFGTLDYQRYGPGPNDYNFYNAAMVTDTLGHINVQPPYRKRYLVPIVERVPFLNPRWFESLKYFGGFGRGVGIRPFVVPFGKVGVLICYESIFGDLARGYRRAGADMLLNITNDAWFGRTSAPYQHEAHLRLRAIENRVGIVRAANTGISEYIDPFGVPHGSTSLYVAAHPVYSVGTTSIQTLYVRAGDWLGLACVALTIVLLVTSVAGAILRRP